ncbi:hypothetical protein M0R04_00255 [Candidatus Dojkabacteria bacterium]|jgi:hypothetical protein|nr:hypothetical protein [Candidatus Dojkabacteria bacterium]
MSEEKKIEEVKKVEEVKAEKTTEKAEVAPEGKKKSSKTLLIIIIVVVIFLIISSVGGYFLVKGLIKSGKDKINDLIGNPVTNNETSDTTSEDTWTYDATTTNKVNGTLDKTSIINAKFPTDIPLCGGVVTSSSYDSTYEAEVKIDTASTVTQAVDWYVIKLAEKGWTTSSQTQEEPIEGYITAYIEFKSADEKRTGDIKIETIPLYKVATVTITEDLM